MILTKEKIEQFSKMIEVSDNIVILSHFNPDGDAVGSTTGLYKFLQNLGKKNLSIIYPNEYAQNLSFLFEGVNHLIASNGLLTAKQLLKQADLLIFMDLNRISRTSEELQCLIEPLDIPKILIDHHIDPHQFDISFSDSEASSTAELTYKIIKQLDSTKIDLNVAKSIYTGICTDTGSFSYSCSRKDCFEVAAELVDLGLEIAPLKRQVFDLSSENRLKLLGYLLSEKLRVFSEYKAAYISVSKQELRQFNFQKGDLEGVVNYCLKIEGIEFAALLSERQDTIRLSFRSTNPSIDVNKFANQYWNGGGHILAAGGNSTLSLEETEKILEEQIHNNLHESNY
ncbi:MAG: bifunctional oligoribonuclease/PAP phosphatase NrnA [Bacteroidales bacterium]|nr:bifunctional oligoribonuclease/PAP phosphatase NrnA [Bacteroidales bacterium]